MSGDGSIIKADRDYTKEVDAAIPEAEKIAQVRTYHLHDSEDYTDSSIEWTNTAGSRQAAQSREADTTIIRSPIHIAPPRSNRHDIEAVWRLVTTE